MTVKRVSYGIILILSIVAFIMTDSGIALFFLVSIAALPVLSFVMLLIAKNKFEFDFEVHPSCIRGGALQITVRAKVSPRFLIGYVRALVLVENTTFGKTERKNILFRDLSFNPHTFEHVGSDSGRIFVRFDKIRLIDIFGLSYVTVKCGKYAEATISPVLQEEVNVRMGPSRSSVTAGAVTIPRKGSDHTEIYGIRDYSPGDSLNSVHWKMSGKFDTLKTKEFGSSDDRQVLILVDLSRQKSELAATDEQLNGVLDVAVSVSNSLKDDVRHTVGRFTDGEFFCSEVFDSDTFVQMVNELMSIKVENNSEAVFYFEREALCSTFTQIIYITSYLNKSELSMLGEHVTAMAVGFDSGQLLDGAVKIIDVPYQRIGAELSGVEL